MSCAADTSRYRGCRQGLPRGCRRRPPAWSLPRARGYPAIPWAWRRSESRYARRLPVGRALSSSAFGLPHVLRSHHGEIPVLGSVDVAIGNDRNAYRLPDRLDRIVFRLAPIQVATCAARSEDHTSELQSLMRLSYAVFCLKKKQTHPYSTDATNTTR